MRCDLLPGRVAHQERGASAVEAALVTPVVVSIIFGIMELGFFFKDYLAAEAMVRSGVRLASASPRTTDFATKAKDRAQETGTALDYRNVTEFWVYKANAANDFPEGNSSFSSCSTCVKFQWDATAKAFVKISDTWAAATQNACGIATSGGPPDRIGVYVKATHPSLSGLVFNSMDISASTVMSLEPIPAVAGCKNP